MNKIKISVVMSVFNSKDFLVEAIESVLSQTFKDFEFIIINDCSTDNSLNIIKEYMKKDKRIVLINNSKNIGLTKSLNKGLGIAKGKYIARMDADDISLFERFEKQYDFLEKNKNIFLVGSGTIEIDNNGRKIRKFYRIKNPFLLRLRLQKKNCIYHPSIIFRNFKDIKYREKFVYSQDYDFFLLILSINRKVSNLKESLIKYRINPNAISWNKFIQQKMFAEKAREFYFQRKRFGKDEYQSFDEKEILNLKNISKRVLLEKDLLVAKKMNDSKKFILLFKEYCNKYGFFNRHLLSYIRFILQF